MCKRVLVRLGELIEEVSMRNKSNLDFPVYSVTNSAGFVPSEDYFSKEVYSKNLTNYKIVHHSMFAYNPSRINVGSIAWLKENISVIISPLYIVFKINKNILNQQYLCYFLKGKIGLSYIKNLTSGSVRDSLKFSALKKIIIPLPPLEIQEKIVDILDTVSELLILRKQRFVELDLLIKSIFDDMFGDLVTNEKKWETKKLEELIIDVKNGITRRGKENSTGSIVLKLKNIRENYIDFDDINKFVLNNKESTLFELKSNQLLFIRVNGSPAYVGRCTVFNGFDQKVYYNDHIMRVTINEDKLNPVYLSRLLNFPYGKKEIKNYLKTSAGQYTINQQGLSNLVIPLPAMELQNQFVETITKIEGQKDLVKKAINETQCLLDSLMAKYFE